MPSVTGILGVVNKPVLIPWAARETADYWRAAIQPDCSYEAETLEAVYYESKRTHRKKKQEAADIGTQAHHAIEGYLVGSTGGPPAESDGRVINCFNAAVNWISSKNFETVAVEKRVYSRRHKYAGTLDLNSLAHVGGELAVVDWKSSKEIWDEYRMQTAAYVYALEEETGERINKRVIVRLGKDDGEFEAKEFTRAQYRKDFKAFLGALEIYKWQRYVADESKSLGAAA